MRTLLVTVGSTKFDGLIQRIQQDYKEFEQFLQIFAIDKVVIQHGKSSKPDLSFVKVCNFETVKYLEPEEMSKLIKESTVIISHGGAGTIFEVLRAKNGNLEAFIVVENESLMDSHQSELIDALLAIKCPIQKATLDTLFRTVEYSGDVRKFVLPAPDNSMLVSLINSYL